MEDEISFFERRLGANRTLIQLLALRREYRDSFQSGVGPDSIFGTIKWIGMQIPVGRTDDPDFVELLNCLLHGLASAHAPHEIWVVKIDNWFDHKWLRFSGIGIVDFNSGLTGHFDAALDEFRQDKLTFPPFPPNRVLSQWSFLRNDAGYAEAPLPTIVHATERQRSQRNLQRRVQNFSPSACFLWYSSNSQQNGKASVMQYGAKAGEVASWFASFARRDGWKLQSTKGISQKEVHELVSST